MVGYLTTSFCDALADSLEDISGTGCQLGSADRANIPSNTAAAQRLSNTKKAVLVCSVLVFGVMLTAF